MKAVLLVKDYDKETNTLGEIGCREVAKPQIIHADDVLIKVAYASLCGSDPNLLKGLFPFKAPFQWGHEFSGIIEEMGPGATKKGLKVGDRVTGNFYKTCGACHYCRNMMEQFCPHPEENPKAQAQYFVLRESQVYVIPDSVDLKEATLIEPFAIAVRAIEKSDIKIGQRIAISGGGGIGLMIAQLARKAGASKVVVIEPVKSKRQLALEMGADVAIDPLAENLTQRSNTLTNGYGFDAVIEASGNTKAAESCLEIVGNGGTIVYFSMYDMNYELPLNLFKYCYHKELTIKGMFLAQLVFERAVEMMARMDLRPLISKVYSLDECRQAYADQISGQYAKLVFDCQK
jgi:2-desacetyl-2-hydroxyethyl bacteriochlorophyllide A dehydrogenase